MSTRIPICRVVVPGPPGPPGEPGEPGTGAILNAIADLRALAVPPAVNIVEVGSYWGDGGLGGGKFRWDAASTAADDGGQVIAPTGVATGRWKRIVEDGGWHVAMWGAKADGATDATTAIRAAIDFVGLQKGGVIEFGAGVYVHDPISIKYNAIFIRGQGEGYQGNSSAETRASAATRMAWRPGGPSGQPLWEWAPVGGVATDPVQAGGAEKVMLDGANQSSRCLSVLSSCQMRWTNLHCYAATQANIFVGAISGTYTGTNPGTYSSAGGLWQQIRCHNHNLLANTAYALHLTGGQGEGGTQGGNSCFQTFIGGNFISRNNHAVRLEDCDSNQFTGGTMTSEVGGAALVGGLGTGFFGLELCSSTQSAFGVGRGSARYLRFFGIQINDVIVRAAQSAGGAPQGIEIYGNSFANNGGLVYVETPAGGGDAPEALVYDRDGIRIFGPRNFDLDRVHALMLTEPTVTGNLAASPGKGKLFAHTDGGWRVRRSDGRLVCSVPPIGVLSQALDATTWPATPVSPPGSFVNAGTLLNAPLAGNPTKWLKIDDFGIPRYIPAW